MLLERVSRTGGRGADVGTGVGAGVGTGVAGAGVGVTGASVGVTSAVIGVNGAGVGVTGDQAWAKQLLPLCVRDCQELLFNLIGLNRMYQ